MSSFQFYLFEFPNANTSQYLIPGNLVVGSGSSVTITSSSDLTIRGCLDTGNGTLVVKVEDGSTGGSDGDYSVVKTNVSVADDCVRIGRVELDGINNKRSCEKLNTKVSRYCFI